MYEVAWIARFHPSLTKDQARRRWAEMHGPLAAQIPGLQRYVQSHVVGPIGETSAASGARSWRSAS